MNMDISVLSRHLLAMTLRIVLLSWVLVTTGCQSNAELTNAAPVLTMEQEDQLLDEMGIVGRGTGLVFVHGCQSRSAGLVFRRQEVLKVIQQYPDGPLSRRLKAICSFSL